MKSKFILLILVSQFCLITIINAQSVGINTSTTPNASAILDITSTSLGLLPPITVTASLPSSITTPQSLLFYNTTTHAFNYNTATNATPVWATLINATNTFTNSGNNTLISTVSGFSPTTAPTIITSNALALTNANLTSTVNGVANTPAALSLTPAITSVAWTLAGNSNTSASSFLGTIGQQDLIFKANSIERMHISSATATAGFVGIGTAAPLSTLEVNGTYGTVFIKFSASMSIDGTGTVWYSTAANGCTLTLPATVSLANRRYIIINGSTSSSGNKTVLVKNSIGTTIFTVNQYSSIEIIYDGNTSTWLQIFP